MSDEHIAALEASKMMIEMPGDTIEAQRGTIEELRATIQHERDVNQALARQIDQVDALMQLLSHIQPHHTRIEQGVGQVEVAEGSVSTIHFNNGADPEQINRMEEALGRLESAVQQQASSRRAIRGSRSALRRAAPRIGVGPGRDEAGSRSDDGTAQVQVEEPNGYEPGEESDSAESGYLMEDSDQGGGQEHEHEQDEEPGQDQDERSEAGDRDDEDNLAEDSFDTADQGGGAGPEQHGEQDREQDQDELRSSVRGKKRSHDDE
jgi:hypothetical protein